MTNYGYCRVKKSDQETDNQYESLLKNKIPPENIFRDIIIGQSKRTPQYDKLMEILKSGDTLTVLDIDILGQTLEKRMIAIYLLDKNEVLLSSINDDILFNRMGRLKITCMSELGKKEFNRQKPVRTMTGLKKAKARGIMGGRHEGLTEEAKETAKEVARLYREGKMTRIQIMKSQNISLGTFYKYLRHEGVTIGDSPSL